MQQGVRASVSQQPRAISSRRQAHRLSVCVSHSHTHTHTGNAGFSTAGRRHDQSRSQRRVSRYIQVTPAQQQQQPLGTRRITVGSGSSSQGGGPPAWRRLQRRHQELLAVSCLERGLVSGLDPESDPGERKGRAKRAPLPSPPAKGGGPSLSGASVRIGRRNMHLGTHQAQPSQQQQATHTTYPSVPHPWMDGPSYGGRVVCSSLFPLPPHPNQQPYCCSKMQERISVLMHPPFPQHRVKVGSWYFLPCQCYLPARRRG